MWNLECGFPAVPGWIQATHQNKGMITAQGDRSLKRVASHEQNRRNNTFHLIARQEFPWVRVSEGELRREMSLLWILALSWGASTPNSGAVG